MASLTGGASDGVCSQVHTGQQKRARGTTGFDPEGHSALTAGSDCAYLARVDLARFSISIALNSAIRGLNLECPDFGRASFLGNVLSRPGLEFILFERFVVLGLPSGFDGWKRCCAVPGVPWGLV